MLMCGQMNMKQGVERLSGPIVMSHTRLIYDGYLCIREVDGISPANVIREYVWDPTEPVATKPLVFRHVPTTTRAFYLFDANKNVSDLIDADASQGIAAHYDYAPFGALRESSGELASVNPYRFSSEAHDDELGLVYYNYRHHDLLNGRWIRRDPLQEQGGINLYGFVANAPIFKFDWRGLERNTVDYVDFEIPKKEEQVCCPFTYSAVSLSESDRFTVEMTYEYYLLLAARIPATGDFEDTRIFIGTHQGNATFLNGHNLGIPDGLKRRTPKASSL